MSRAVSIVLVSALLGAACSSSDDPPAGPDAASPLTTELELRDGLRDLWSDHVTWTRVYLISAIAGLPDADAAAGRLLQNQDDIGAAIVPFYGETAGAELTVLLREHITIAAEIVVAARASDSAALADASARWTANADQIAAFLAAANPNWPEADLQVMMRGHLDQTIAEATARLTGDWAADIAAYDQIVAHILHMADTLTDGLLAQFPDRIEAGPAAGAELHQAMRALWVDHVAWTRLYLMSAIAGLPDAPDAAGRLLQNQADIGDAIRPFYGDAAGDQLTALFEEHIAIAAEIVTAAKASDASALDDASARWSANADQIAEFLAAANPDWPVDDLKAMMRMHLDQTMVEAGARLGGDWPADIAAYDEVVDHILQMADVLSAGLTAQFPAHHH